MAAASSPPKPDPEEDSDEAAEDASLELVELGVPAAQREAVLFDSHTGGKPLWLHPLLIPDVSCGSCGGPLALLLQLYAPTERPEAFHRYLYLLVCPQSACHFSARLAYQLLRCQLPRVNPFWPPDDPGHPVPPATAASLCVVCSFRSRARCSACKVAAYCGTVHQKLHWTLGHKAACAQLRTGVSGVSDAAAAAWGFPEVPLRTEPEPEEPDTSDSDDPALHYQDKMQPPVEEDEDDDDERKGAPRDAAFSAFAERIARAPQQALRYTNWRDEAVLFVSDERPRPPSPCERCGAQRRAEFQVMPQLLYHLKIKGDMDWGTLVAYTCSASCSPPHDAPYAQELLVRLNFTDHHAPPTAAAVAAAPAQP